jgi:hypothetical protein
VDNEPVPILDRLAKLRDDARDFGDLDLALTMHDARIVILHATGLIAALRHVIAEQAYANARQRIRIHDQVEIIRSLRAERDPAYADDLVPPAPWHG